MSKGNVEVVRRAVDALNRRKMWLDYVDPEVEWIEDPRYPDAQTYRGREGVERSIEKWWDTWASLVMQVEEMVDVEDRVVFWGITEARGHDSDVTVRAPFGGVWEFRDGLVVRVHVLGGRDEALEGAGLRD